MRSIEPIQLKKSLTAAALHLEDNHEVLNRLNVFPVPDGDTGSNMFRSMKAAVESLEEYNPLTMDDMGRIFCRELNKNSRGNSGFILARFFSGFFTGIDGNTLSGTDLRYGFSRGSFAVNTSLFSPKEGTMITVIAGMAEYLNTSPGDNIPLLLRESIIHGREILGETPRLLPILARAGVIDSGALGFIVLLEGFLGGLTGELPEKERESDYRFSPDVSEEGQKEPSVEFRYCTEVLINKSGPLPAEDLNTYLRDRGDSIALVNDENILKVHIHTNNPEELLAHLGTFGEVASSKVEDMQDQISLFEKNEDIKDNAVLALVPGPGFVDIFKTLGADFTLSYAEALPSSDEISQKIKSINNDHIIILTNNRNIIPSASLAKKSAEKAVSILPTENIVQGIAAMYGFSENDSIAENAVNMTDCLGFVDSFEVHQCETAARFGRIQIEKDDFFTTHKDEILAVGQELNQVLMESFKTFPLKDMTNITIYRGHDDKNLNPSDIRRFLLSVNKELELEVKNGGQNKNIAVISLE